MILVSNLRTVELSGVGEPFLMQDIRYHCPTYCVPKDQAAFTINSPLPPPPKNIQQFRHTPQILEILAYPQNIPILYIEWGIVLPQQFALNDNLLI